MDHASAPTTEGPMIMRKLTTRSSWMDFRNALNKREPFKTSGALYAETGGPFWERGRLDEKYYGTLSRANYVVYSYGTPIAWNIPHVGWIMPDESYSVTTTRHQNKIRTALDNR